MTKVTNIYIDTTGFTAEQYEITDNAMDSLKTHEGQGWPVGDVSPRFKRYPILCLTVDGERQYLNNIGEIEEEFETRNCNSITLHELLLLQMESMAGKPLKTGALTVASSRLAAAPDVMTPEKERSIVNGVMDGLLSSRLISKMAHGAVTGAMQGYCATNDT